MKKILKNFVFYYLPTIFWAGVIFYFSAKANFRYEVGNIPTEILMRKMAHFLEFALLAFLVFRIFFKAHGKGVQKSIFWSLILTTLYAGSDEFHQSFVAGRDGNFLDWIFDTLSALATLQILGIYYSYKKRIIRIFIFIFSILALAGIGWLMVEDSKKVLLIGAVEKESGVIEAIGKIEKSVLPSNNSAEKNIPEKKETLPSKILINVPFTSQAPFAEWDAYHEEACEEASLIMVKYFLDKKELSKETAEKEIQALIKYQLNKYGDYKDSDAKQMVDIARDFYGIKNLKIISDVKKEDLKTYLAKGQPIIIPAAGQMLGNPNFKQPGPPYHALVAIGYNGNNIITNDPGTRKGSGYVYNIDVLYDAIHDFPGDLDKIKQGRKVMIVVE